MKNVILLMCTLFIFASCDGTSKKESINEDKDYHKLVFGTITNVWIRK